METLLLSREEVARRAKALYEQSIRLSVETEENIGRMVIIDIESGDFAIDDEGIESARRLRENTRMPVFMESVSAIESRNRSAEL